jgi:hypothetical protein
MFASWMLLIACNARNDAESDADRDPGGTDGPGTTDTGLAGIVRAIAVTQPTEIAPLTRHLHVETSEPATLTARWDDGTHPIEVTWPAGGTVQDHTLLGFHPGATYALTVTAAGDTGATGTASAEVVTDPWPVGLPDTLLVAPQPAAASPGHTLIPINTSNASAPIRAAVMAVDEDGIPCFLLTIDDQLEDAVPYGDGLFVTAGLEQRLARYFHWDGTEEYAFTLDDDAVAPQIPVGALVSERFHHDIVPIPGQPGRFVALARFPVNVVDWRASYDDPSIRANREVSDDAILDFQADGTVNRETILSQIVPMDRIGYDSLEDVYPGWGDWSHANSVWWDDGAYIVSMRHQDAVIKIDPETNQLAWILGNSDNWLPPWSDKLLVPEGDLTWQWHQHAAELGPDAPDGRRQLIVFDNANYHLSPFTAGAPVDGPTRVVQFGIDETAMRVRMDWSYEVSTVTGASMFSEAIGDADFLPNGNILSTWGMLDKLPDGTSNTDAGLGNRTVRIIEFDPTTLEDVWHLYLSVAGALDDAGWTAYRSERIPSLYGRVVD